MNRRRLKVLGVLLLLGAAAWLLFGGERDQHDASLDSSEIVDGRARTDLLRAEAEDPIAEPAGPSLAGRTEDRRDRPARGPVRVRVLGSYEQPLVGVYVQAVATAAAHAPAGEEPESHATDGEGVVVFGDLPYDGSVSVRLGRTHPKGVFVISIGVNGQVVTTAPDKPSPTAATAVTGSEVTLRPNTGMPLHVDVVSADRGHRLPRVKWGVTPRFEALGFDAWQETKDMYPVPVARGEQVTAKFKLLGVPDDHALLDQHDFTFKAHPSARRLLATLPLRPKARIVVLFDTPDGAVGRRWDAKHLSAGAWRAVDVFMDASHRWHVRGVAHIPGERFLISGQLGTWKVTASGRLPIDPDETLVLHAKVRKVHVVKTTTQQAFRLELTRAGTVQALFKPHGSGIHIEFAEALKLQGFVQAAPPPPERTFDVAVRGPDGKPAAGADVWLGNTGTTTSKKGIARFKNPPPGTHVLKVWGAGAVYQQSVTVPEGVSASTSVGPGIGGDVRVEVVDEAGHPMPFATLKVEQKTNLPWCDVFDGMHRIDPYTDARGRRLLHGVAAAETRITATLGSRSATVKLKVLPGRTVRARIVLRHPEPKKKKAR